MKSKVLFYFQIHYCTKLLSFFTQTVDILHILSFYISKYFILRYVYNIEHRYLQDILHKTRGR